MPELSTGPSPAPRTSVATVRRWALLAAGVAAIAASLAACGGEDVGAKPQLPTETPALFNPCDGLEQAAVQEAVGATTMTKSAGKPTSPECRFAPAKGSGEPAVTVNYTLFSGTLDEYFANMGASPTADVSTPAIANADSTRVVVSAEKDQLYVTGFVQTGSLFQVVNVVDPAPYDRAREVAGVQTIMTALVQHARSVDAGAPPPTDGTDGASPSAP